jgi:hypothetical protein
MDADVTQEAREVGKRLRELLEHPATDQPSLQRWTDDAMRFSKCWSPSLCNRLPHELWHWLSDADVRFENPEYARIQNEWVAGVIAWLEAGAENRWQGADHPPWPRVGRWVLPTVALVGLAALLLCHRCS